MVKLSDAEYQAILNNEKRAVNALGPLRVKVAELEAALAEEKATISRYQKADDAAVQLLEKAKMTLEVPAAEYVPAISDAWDLIELALGKIR